MGKISTGAFATAGTVGGMMAVAAQTKPEDAISNLGGWKKLVTGTVNDSGILASPYVDTVATVIGVIMLVVALTWFFWPQKPPLKMSSSADLPPVPPQGGDSYVNNGENHGSMGPIHIQEK